MRTFPLMNKTRSPELRHRERIARAASVTCIVGCMVTSALPIAVLDQVLPAQLDANPRDAEGLDVVWSGMSLPDLERTCAATRPKVVIADLDLLGADPAAAVARILSSSGAHLFITVYHFARREVLDGLASDKVRVVKAPISLGLLRTQMMSVVVSGLLGRGAITRPATPAAAAAARRVTAEPLRRLPPPRYSKEQIGRLQELVSSVQCECPNHLATLLGGLVAFEEYSRNCESKNGDDAAVHALLAHRTAEARIVMEAALDRLLEHEGIRL